MPAMLLNALRLKALHFVSIFKCVWGTLQYWRWKRHLADGSSIWILLILQISYCTRKTKQRPDWAELLCPQGGLIHLYIYKTTTATDIKGPLKLHCHSDLSTRTDTKTVLRRNKERSWNQAATVRRLSTSQRLLPAESFFSQRGKITLSTLCWQNDRDSFNHFPSRISEVSAHFLIFSMKGDRMGSKQVQIVFSHILIGLMEPRGRRTCTNLH